MDQNLLLTAEKLMLNPDIQKGWSAHGAFVLKNLPGQTYLLVSNAQAAVLGAFTQPSTVPDVLARLLRERTCLPLREYYELVVKAYEAGVLITGQSRKPVRNTVPWPSLKVNPQLVIGSAATLTLVTFIQLVIRPPMVAETWPRVAIALALALVVWGLGRMLAAMFLVGIGGGVYGRFSASLPFDLRDARLFRPLEQALIILGGNLPLTLWVLGLQLNFSSMAAPAAVIWLLAWRPWGQGIPRRLAGLLSRYPHLDTDTAFKFVPNNRPQLHWREWWRRWDWRVCAIELAWAAVWSLMVAHLALRELGLSFMDLNDWEYWALSLAALGAALLFTVMVVMVRRWRDGIRVAWRSLHQRGARVWKRWRADYPFPDNEAAMLRLAAAHPLLGHLNPYDQTALVRTWRPVKLKAWSRLVGPEKPSDQVGLILSGLVSVQRVGRNGRSSKMLLLDEGNFFGLPIMRAGGGHSFEIKSRTPIAAMIMPTTVFESSVVARLGAETAYDLTHKYAFLKQLPLCRSWHTHAVARFAKLARIADYSDGEAILHEKGDTRWFYIVYDGVAQVRRRGKLLSRLGAGDFFGEISLLQNSGATADIVAQGALQCLQIDQASFLRFMTHNHHVALQLEKISSARLGRPIFPLTPTSF